MGRLSCPMRILQKRKRPREAAVCGSNGRNLLEVEEAAQRLRPRGVAQLPKGLCLDLPDALARHVELLADFFERVVGVHLDAEAHAQHLRFARRQRIEHVIVANLKDQTSKVLRTLTPREEQVLKMRFGVGDGAEHTLEEVGQQFSVTRERIRQIEAKALRKLKHPSRSRKLRSFLDN